MRLYETDICSASPSTDGVSVAAATNAVVRLDIDYPALYAGRTSARSLRELPPTSITITSTVRRLAVSIIGLCLVL